jgi:hypothetical protein
VLCYSDVEQQYVEMDSGERVLDFRIENPDT